MPDTYRTLFRDGDHAVILDQTLLPHRCETRTLASLADAARAITSMQVRGAPLIGATAACGLALAMQREATDEALAQALATLAATRPTAVNLQWALNRVGDVLRAAAPAARARLAWSEFEAICAEDVDANAAIGRHGLALIRDISDRRGGSAVRVMTHCNAGWLATLGHGTALAPVYAAQDAGIAVEVWVSETRPRNQGLLTAWELGQSRVPCRLLADNAAGILLARGEVDLVITGADRVAANGDSANKVGTYLKALAAHDNDVPFYIAAPGSTIDFACAGGDAIPIEDRGPRELREVSGLQGGKLASLRLAADEVDAINPAFDVTPARLIRGIVTERGMAQPDGLAALFPERIA